MDDPPTKDGPKAYSYCWPTQAYCDYAYKKYVKDRPWVKPCRPHTPVYCYELFSPQFQARRFSCSATMEHCEAHQKSVLGKLEPDGDYRWTQCTEQP